jgi:hypothetical protein
MCEHEKGELQNAVLLSRYERVSAIAFAQADMSLPIRLDERIGDYALTEIRRFQIAEKPPSTFNSTPFTKLESSEARNSATDAISSG